MLSKTENIIEVKNLNVQYFNIKILNNVSFNVPRGAICAFIGANGAGKTTTIKSIIGLAPLQKNVSTLALPDIKINKISNTLIRSHDVLRYVPEKESFTNVTVKQFLKDEANYYGIRGQQFQEFLDKMFKRFGFPTNKLELKMADLSSGLKKIIMLIQSFLSNPKIIVMDEPTENLDPTIRTIFWELVDEYNATHDCSFFISSHNLDEIEKYINYVVLISNGKIYFEGAWEHNTGTLRNKYDQFIRTGLIDQFYETVSDATRYEDLYKRGLLNDRDMRKLKKVSTRETSKSKLKS